MDSKQLFTICKKFQGNNTHFDSIDLTKHLVSIGVSTTGLKMWLDNLVLNKKIACLEIDKYCIVTYHCRMIKHNPSIAQLVHTKLYWLFKHKEVGFFTMQKYETEAMVEVLAHIDEMYIPYKIVSQPLAQMITIKTNQNAENITESFKQFLVCPSATNFRKLENKMLEHQEELNKKYTLNESDQ